jgi:hypothetical protein
MNNNHVQEKLFQQIKQRMPTDENLSEVVGKVLGISYDSAYRRVKGETALDLGETQMLCRKFGISLDLLMGLSEGKITFTSNLIDQDNFDFEEYMRGLLRNLQYFNSFPERKLYYECKDIPIFYHFHSREIAAFKYYFWMKFLLQQPHFKTRKFSFDDYSDNLFELGQQALHLYNIMPSVEFWNIESMSSMLRQIQFFYDTGCFKNKADVLLIYAQLEAMMEYIEQATEQGKKMPLANRNPEIEGGSFEVFHNEVILGNNMIIAKLGASQITFLNHSIFNYAATPDVHFGAYIFRFTENLMKSSTRLSAQNEFDRNAFFGAIRNSIKQQIRKLH